MSQQPQKTRRKSLAELVSEVEQHLRDKPRPRSNKVRQEPSPEARAYLAMIRSARAGLEVEEVSPPPTLEQAALDLTAYTCASCRDLGWIRQPTLTIRDKGFGALVPCPHCNGEGDKVNAAAKLAQASRLNTKELKTSLASFWSNTTMRSQARTAVGELLERGQGWLTLWGDNGSGKTYLAMAAVTKCIGVGVEPDAWSGKEAQYWMLADLLDALRDAYDPSRGEPDYNGLLDELAALPLLVVDECIAFSPKPWALEKIRQLAERRYRDEQTRMTTWVSNASPTEQAKAGGPLAFLFSRMRQYQVIELNDGDVRPRLGERYQHD